MGKTVDLDFGTSAGGARIGAVLRGWMGWTGVPNAGDEDGIGLAGTAEGFSGRLAVAMSCCACVWLDATKCPVRGLIEVDAPTRRVSRDASAAAKELSRTRTASYQQHQQYFSAAIPKLLFAVA